MSKFSQFAVSRQPAGQSPSDAAALAAADAQVGRTQVAVNPVEQLQERTPQASPSGLQGAERVRQMAEEGQLIQPAGDNVRQMGTEEAAQLYAQEVQTPYSQDPKTGAVTGGQALPRGTVDIENAVINLPMPDSASSTVSEVAEGIAKMEHAFDPAIGSLATGGIGTNVALAGLEALGLTEGAISPKTGKASPMKYDEKLGREVPTKVQPKAGTGGAAFLGALVTLGRLKDNAGETAEYQGEGEFKERSTTKKDLNKTQLLSQFGTELEQLVAPPTTISPEGEAQQAGFESRLTPEQKDGVGEAVWRMMEQSGFIHDTRKGIASDNALITRVGGGGSAGTEKYTYTEKGIKFLEEMAPVLNEIAPATVRPVSLTPQVGGHYPGGLATRQKERTKVPDEDASPVTQDMQDALDVIGTTANIVSDYKLDMLEMMYQDIVAKDQLLTQQARLMSKNMGIPVIEAKALLIDQNKDAFVSEFAEQFDVGGEVEVKTFNKSKNSVAYEITATWNAEMGEWVNEWGDPILTQYSENTLDQDVLNTMYPNKEDGFTVQYPKQPGRRKQTDPEETAKTHGKHAADVVTMAMKKLETTLRDAKNRQGKAFYYGGTVIGNSGRIMISQTELNPQSNKIARFLVDNPRATKVVIDENGRPSKAFRYIVARGAVDSADLYTPDALLALFDANKAEFDRLGKLVYDANRAPPAERAQRMSQAVKEVKESKIVMGDWEGSDEWGFALDNIHEWGKMNAAKEAGNSYFYTRAKAEVDGINNGSSIQGLQFGDKAILERAGLIFDFEEGKVQDEEGNWLSVIPAGNMRDFTMGKLFTDPGIYNDLAAGAMDDVRDAPELIKRLLPIIAKDGKMRKKFIKIPLMTTIYGKGSGGHGDTAESFLDEYGDKLGIPISERKAVIKGFTQVIQNALKAALNEPLVHQDLVKKQAAWFFTVMNEVPKIKGPNGYIVQSGGVDFIANPELGKTSQINVPHHQLTEGGERDLEATSKGSLITGKGAVSKLKAPSATSRKAGSSALWGEQTRNQLAVNGTHNIDSTVAQRTIVESKKKMGNSFWGHQIFDAFMGDVSSMQVMLDEGNKQFLEVNRNYNMIQAEYDAFNEALKAFDKKIADLGDTPISLEDSMGNPWKGIPAFINNFLGSQGDRSRGAWRGGSDGKKKFIDFVENQLGLKLENVKPLDADGNPIPTPKGKDKQAKYKTLKPKQSLKPQQVKELINYMMANFLSPRSVVVEEVNGKPRLAEGADWGVTMREAFKANIARTEQAKRDFYEQYKDYLHLTRQFN